MNPLFSTLARSEKASFDALVDVHDRLNASADPFMLYAAGWAALYASQKDAHSGADNYLEIALDHWREIEPSMSSNYECDPNTLSLQAKLCISMVHVLRNERQLLSERSRRDVYAAIGAVATECIHDREAAPHRKLGLMAEIAFLQLLWRPSDHEPLNAVPAGPGKDARKHSQFNTDLYAYLPGTPKRKKGVNIQVKATLDADKTRKYDQSVMVLLGGNSHLLHPSRDVSGETKVKFTAQACAEESHDGNISSANKSILDRSTSFVYKTIRDALDIRMQRYQKESPEIVDIRDEGQEKILDIRETTNQFKD
jgi:hypothetical protein